MAILPAKADLSYPHKKYATFKSFNACISLARKTVIESRNSQKVKLKKERDSWEWTIYGYPGTVITDGTFVKVKCSQYNNRAHLIVWAFNGANTNADALVDNAYKSVVSNIQLSVIDYKLRNAR